MAFSKRTCRAILFLSAAMLFFVGVTVLDFDTGLDVPLISAAMVVVIALPSYYVFLRYAGWRKGLPLLLLLSAIPLIVEAQAVVTGFPYGGFHYSDAMGPKAFDLVPWTVAFAYLPILLGSFTLASRIPGGGWIRIVMGSAAILVIADLVLDPAIVHAGLWIWEDGGAYYGVPAVNFLGWLLTGAVYSAILYVAFKDRLEAGEKVPAWVSSSLLLIMAMWTGYVIQNGLLVPSVLGLGLLAVLALVNLRGLEGIASQSQP